MFPFIYNVFGEMDVVIEDVPVIVIVVWRCPGVLSNHAASSKKATRSVTRQLIHATPSKNATLRFDTRSWIANNAPTVESPLFTF